LQCALRGSSDPPNCDYETKRWLMPVGWDHRIRGMPTGFESG
jgi:hypothetical protein